LCFYAGPEAVWGIVGPEAVWGIVGPEAVWGIVGPEAVWGILLLYNLFSQSKDKMQTFNRIIVQNPFSPSNCI
jgi:hypothetical protein